jgi:cytidyltransferase-like protein
MDWEKLSASKKIVLAGGVFDIIHPGHIHTLNAAKALGDVLVVVIATDKTALKMKKRPPLHNQELRRELVSCLTMVDMAIIGHEENIFETVKEVKPNIIVLGYDQVHQDKFIGDGCKRINIDVEIVRLQSPVPELSSSDIEKKYGKDIHGL